MHQKKNIPEKRDVKYSFSVVPGIAAIAIRSDPEIDREIEQLRKRVIGDSNE